MRSPSRHLAALFCLLRVAGATHRSAISSLGAACPKLGKIYASNGHSSSGSGSGSGSGTTPSLTSTEQATVCQEFRSVSACTKAMMASATYSSSYCKGHTLAPTTAAPTGKRGTKRPSTTKPTAAPKTKAPTSTAAPTTKAPTSPPSTASPTAAGAVRSITSITLSSSTPQSIDPGKIVTQLQAEARKSDSGAEVRLVRVDYRTTFDFSFKNVSCADFAGDTNKSKAILWMLRAATATKLGLPTAGVAQKASCAGRRRQLRRGASGALSVKTTATSTSKAASGAAASGFGSSVASNFQSQSANLPAEYTSVKSAVSSASLPAPTVSAQKYSATVVTQVTTKDAASMASLDAAVKDTSKLKALLTNAGVDTSKVTAAASTTGVSPAAKPAVRKEGIGNNSIVMMMLICACISALGGIMYAFQTKCGGTNRARAKACPAVQSPPRAVAAESDSEKQRICSMDRKPIVAHVAGSRESSSRDEENPSHETALRPPTTALAPVSDLARISDVSDLEKLATSEFE